jgi:hypothetical protein
MVRHSLDVVEVDKVEVTTRSGVNGNHYTSTAVKHIREEEYGVPSFYFTNFLNKYHMWSCERNLRFAIV